MAPLEWRTCPRESHCLLNIPALDLTLNYKVSKPACSLIISFHLSVSVYFSWSLYFTASVSLSLCPSLFLCIGLRGYLFLSVAYLYVSFSLSNRNRKLYIST